MYQTGNTIAKGLKCELTERSIQGSNILFCVVFFPAFSLSLQPFEHPLCTKDGVIFDLL